MKCFSEMHPERKKIFDNFFTNIPPGGIFGCEFSVN